MPTHESADAFAKLAAARARLNEVTKLINECHASLSSDGQAGRQRYADLQAEWHEAFQAFAAATEAFSATVKKLNDDVEARDKQ